MSFQQSLNQTLYTAGIASGLYQRSDIAKINSRMKVFKRKALHEEEGTLSSRSLNKLGEFEDEKFEATGNKKYADRAEKRYREAIEQEENERRIKQINSELFNKQKEENE